ncbi:PIN domain-containing protein [Candidatus Woesearchaeota archaeon]|nr:PIN domain-containing protein [Candidatus Woesearchaeota archaeon]
MKPFIDSTVIICAFTPNENRESCQKILKQGGFINGLVLIESFDVIERITKNRAYALRVVRSLMASDLEITQLSNAFIFEALKRSSRNKLRIFNLIHYSTALLNSCSGIVSYDKHFDGLEIRRVEP